jgi:two-component system, LuxR family, sensor kinase FixL
MSESDQGSNPPGASGVGLPEIDSNQADTAGTQQTLVESDLLLGLYRTLIEHADLASGLSSALEIVCRFAGWDVGTAWLPSEDKQHIRLFVSWHQDDPRFDEFIGYCRDRIFSRSVGMPGRVWDRKAVEWTSDLTGQEPEFFRQARSATAAGIKAALGVPILHETYVVGVLLFYTREVKKEDENLVRVVSRVATQLGFALRHKLTEEDLRRHQTLVERSRDELEMRVTERTVQLKVANEGLQSEIYKRERVQDEMQIRVRQQEAVAEIGERALQDPTLSTLLDAVCDTVVRTLDVEFCKILELEPDGKTLLLRAGVGWKEGLVGHATVEAGLRSQAGYALVIDSPVIVEDLSSETHFTPPPLLVDHGVMSGMSVIIPGREQPFGVLGAHTSRRRTFRNEDIHFLESVAHILSEAIERSRSELAIQSSHSWLRSLIATTQDAVVSIDRRGCVVLFNESAERIFGYRAAEITGHKVNVLMAEPYAAEHDDYIARYEKTGEPRAIGRIRTVTARRQDGTLFPIELSVTEIEVNADVRYAAFIRDISDKTRLQQQLVESEKLAAIGGTAAKIGHEIANPLNGIYLTLQLVEQRLGRHPSADKRVTADVLKIKKEIARLNQLVQEFRTLSRPQDYHFLTTNVGAMIADILDLQRPLCESRGIKVRRRIAFDVPTMRVDEDKLKQALLNLIKNASEAMPTGGTLSVALNHLDGRIMIEIADTGSGIPAGTDVFAPFFTTKKEGTGLGLIIVRQIISAHGGTIFYDSQPGMGTTFHITLPRDPSVHLNRQAGSGGLLTT